MIELKEALIGKKNISNATSLLTDKFTVKDLKPGVIVKIYCEGWDGIETYVYLPEKILGLDKDAFVRYEDSEDIDIEYWYVDEFIDQFPYDKLGYNKILSICGPFDILKIKTPKDVKNLLEKFE